MSNTNANIRFYNAFQMKYVKNRVKTFNDARLSDRMKVKTEPIEEAEVSISNADFSNTNLKGNKFLTIELENCDFSNTGIKITNYTSYEKTNFSNNDFSYYEIDADYIDNLDSNFSNTGAKIIVDHYKTFERNIKKCYAQGGNIDGCYIDGVLYEYDKTELSSKKKR